MMDDLFKSVDVDFNLDLGVDSSNGFDFLPEDLFNFIDDDLHEDLKEIAENDVIPNIERLMNFDEDDQFVGEIQWDEDLDTTDFVKNVNVQVSSNHQQTIEKNKSPNQTTYDENTSSTSPNSPTASYSIESSSNDSTDFLDMFQNYYSLDSNNQLVSHPISSLSTDDIHKLTNSLAPNGQTYSFDLSNNFGGFVDMQSALSLVNGAPSMPKLMTNSKHLIKRKKSKGTSLLANKPKSYRTIKKEMLQKNLSRSQLMNCRTKTKNQSTDMIDECMLDETSISIIEVSDERSFKEQSNQSYIITTTYAQDHDYCSPMFDYSSHS